jgi:hypothetical protein
LSHRLILPVNTLSYRKSRGFMWLASYFGILLTGSLLQP